VQQLKKRNCSAAVLAEGGVASPAAGCMSHPRVSHVTGCSQKKPSCQMLRFGQVILRLMSATINGPLLATCHSWSLYTCSV
jgi:hypothetical protein